MAARLPVAGAGVGVEEIGGPGGRDHAGLRPQAAVHGAVDGADHRRAGYALADDGQQVRLHKADLHGPARQERARPVDGRAARVARRFDRVKAAVRELQLSGLGEHGERGRVEVAGVQAAVGARLILLVRADHDLRFSVSVDVTDGRRVDDRPLVELVADPAREGGRVGGGVDRRDLGAVDHEYGEAAHGRAVAVPRVDVAVHVRRDDLGLAVTVEVRHHR